MPQFKCFAGGWGSIENPAMGSRSILLITRKINFSNEIDGLNYKLY